MNNTQRIYFPNLNGIRFIAAFLVIIHHIEQFKSIFHIPSYWNGDSFITKIIGIIGGQGVNLFFVLSGFLITYLLLAEERKINTIDIKKFYIRRILRIWPLYVLIVSLSLFVFPHIHTLSIPGFPQEMVQSNIEIKVVLYLFFFANLVLAFFGMIPYASQTWSIGTEEQFYLIWPIVIRFIKKNRLFLMISIIVFYNILKLFLFSHTATFIPYHNIIKAFWSGFKVDNMAIGGFFAVLLFINSHDLLLKLFNNQIIFLLALLFIFINFLFGMYYPYINNIIYSGCYGIIILNFAANNRIKISFENKTLNSLGNISYGLYMLHPLAIVLVIKIGLKYSILTNYFLYPTSLILTIFLSYLVYYCYESFFLRFKSNFTIVKSGQASP